MTELLSAAQMREIEAAAMASGAVTGLELMERAGRGVVEAVLAHWPELALTSHRARVLCGPGNNGGDGFVVARLLHEHGWDVDARLLGDPTRLPPDARTNFHRWQERVPAGQRTRVRNGGSAPVRDADLVVDAVFGTGLTRPVTGAIADALRGLAQDRDRSVAIDAPSGLCLDSGRFLFEGEAPRAALTVTFERPKIGHYLGQGPWHCGARVVADIGLARFRVATRGAGRVRLTDGRGLGAMLSKQGATERHKYHHGHAIVLSGGPGKGGAARLAARGALRIGAGLVTVACPPGALQENAARLDAVMLKSVRDAGGLADVLQDTRLNAVCLGPGLGHARARELVPVALAARGPGSGSGTGGAVLDADALTAYAQAPDRLFAMLPENCVLTPHGGEFAALFPDIADLLNAPATSGPAFSKVDATRQAARRAGCTILYKGPDTVIAAADGRAAINSAHDNCADPWLATAGSGDVLAGFVTGLLARGFDPFEAAQSAARVHVDCARAVGPGLIAEDLPETLPQVLAALMER